MRSIRFLSLGIAFGLSASAYGDEGIIKDRSPDGRFALQLNRNDEEGMYALGIIDIAAKKELVSLEPLGNPYAKESHLAWSPDSKRVAFNASNRRGGEATVYQLKDNAFVEVKLPQTPDCEAKHVSKVYEASVLAQRWADPNTLLMIKRGGWNTEDGGEGECEKVITMKFDPNGKASIQNVKSVSARELADRAKAVDLVQSGADKSEAGDHKGAIDDYDRAIKLDPKSSDAYNNRGGEKQDAGDLEGAIADYNHAIEVNPDAFMPYFNRGAVYFLKADWKKTISDLQHHEEWDDTDEDSPAVIWIAEVRLGEKEAADRELAKFISDHPDFAEDWKTKIDMFLLGKVSEEDLLRAIEASAEDKQREERCSACYYIGVKHLLNEDKAGAADAFQKSIATEDNADYEYDFAKAELKRLGK